MGGRVRWRGAARERVRVRDGEREERWRERGMDGEGWMGCDGRESGGERERGRGRGQIERELQRWPCRYRETNCDAKVKAKSKHARHGHRNTLAYKCTRYLHRHANPRVIFPPSREAASSDAYARLHTAPIAEPVLKKELYRLAIPARIPLSLLAVLRAFQTPCIY